MIERGSYATVILVSLVLLSTGCAQTSAVTPGAEAGAPRTFPNDPLYDEVEEEEEPEEVIEGEQVESSIRKVTVYSDRALITRDVEVEVSDEPQVFVFTQLPGWVDDGSVRVSVSDGRLMDVQVRRRFLTKASDKSYREAEEALEELAHRQLALDDELKILDAQKKQIEEIRAFSLEKVTQDTTLGTKGGLGDAVGVKTYGNVVTFISDSLRQTAEARREVLRKRSKLAPRLEASQKRLNELKNLAKLEETMVFVTIKGGQASESTIELSYLLPGVTWEPVHEVRLDTATPGQVEVNSFAIVTQTSGEDWGNAELSFSTQSSTQSVRIPELEQLTLGDTQTASRIITSQVSSFSRAQKAFEGQNHYWNKLHNKSSLSHFEKTYQSNFEYLQIAQSKTVQLFQRLQLRGTTAHFKAIEGAIVRGDGSSTRLPTGRSALKASQKIVAAPEQSLNAARTLEMVNSSSEPFLPGKVALYQDGAFLGMTDMDFIAEGERFALFAGVADHLKLSREMDRKQSSLTRKKRTRMKVVFIVTVENLSPREATLTLADRIPVSENKDIRIYNVRVSPTAEPNSQGLLSWGLRLKPQEARKFEISYEVEYPPTLILETKRKRMRRPAPSPSSPAERYDFEDQLLDMEQNF